MARWWQQAARSAERSVGNFVSRVATALDRFMCIGDWKRKGDWSDWSSGNSKSDWSGGSSKKGKCLPQPRASPMLINVP